jgi:hypothetical protein
MKKISLVLLLALFQIACKNSGGTKKIGHKDSAEVIYTPEHPGMDVDGTPVLPKPGTYQLACNNDSLLQTMDVKYVGKKEIEFELRTANTARKIMDVLKGVATMDDKEGDPEEDVGDDGVSFLYDNWHYVKNKCQLYMRIADSAEYIKIFEYDCKSLHNVYCPLETGKVLKRIDLR